jgi:hypothetical protein
MNGISSQSEKTLKEKQGLEKRFREVNREIQAITSEITDATGARTQDWRINAYLLLKSKTADRGKIKVKYLIPNANWLPLYDVRAELNSGSSKAKIRLVTSGSVTQNTGEHWDKISLNFSTVDPSPLLNPEFRRWVLSEQRIEEVLSKPQGLGFGGAALDRSADMAYAPEGKSAKRSAPKKMYKQNRAAKEKAKLRQVRAAAPMEAEADAFMDESEDLDEVLEAEAPARSAVAPSMLVKGQGVKMTRGRDMLFPESDLKSIYPSLASLNSQYSGYLTSKPQHRNFFERVQSVKNPGMIQGRPLFLKSPFKTSVVSGSTDQKIPIKTETLTGDMKYFAIPKDQKWGYVKLEARNPSRRNLLAGRGQIFLNGELTSKTDIPMVGPNGKFMINLGPDRNIETKRKVDRKSEEKGLIMKDHSVNVTVELEILNHYRYPISLNLKDQVPLSSNEEVKISKIEIDEGGNKEKNGIITWNLRLKSKEKRKIKFSYNVTHPKNYIVEGIDQ